MLDSKKNLEKIRTKYYESCKVVQEQERSVSQKFAGKLINTDKEINIAHDNLLKFRSQSENLAQLYKYEISKYNKIAEENEKKHYQLMEKVRTAEESRIFFIKCNMDKFAKVFEEFTLISFDFLNVY
jgi:UDP-2,3-diacylglucosamine pyrophosphatase LpxH